MGDLCRSKYGKFPGGENIKSHIRAGQCRGRHCPARAVAEDRLFKRKTKKNKKKTETQKTGKKDETYIRAGQCW